MSHSFNFQEKMTKSIRHHRTQGTFIDPGCGIGHWSLSGLMFVLAALCFIGSAHGQLGIRVVGQPTLSRQTGLFVQEVEVTNNSGIRQSGWRIHADQLPAGVRFWNRSGETGNVPFMDIPGDLAPGGTMRLQLQYYDPTRAMVTQTAPVLTIQPSAGAAFAISSPAESAALMTSPATITGTAPSGTTAVMVNGVPATLTGNGWNAAIPLHQGRNILTVTLTRTGDQTETLQRTVSLASSPVTVAVTFPADQATVADESISVSGIINDIVSGTINPGQATVTINGRPAQVSNRCFLLSQLQLQPGENEIVAEATDAEGNVGRNTIRVTYVPPMGQSVLMQVSGNGQSGPINQTLPQPLVVKLQDASGSPVANKPVAFRIKSNDGRLMAAADSGRAVLVQSDAQGLAQVNWVLGGRAGAGNNVVQATSAGFAGKAIFSVVAATGTPAKINVEANGNQFGCVDHELPLPLVAVVTDAGHNRLGGIPVTFTVVSGGGKLENGATTLSGATDSDGRLSVRYTLGSVTGRDNNRIEANFPGNAGLPAVFVASAFNQGAPEDTAVVGVVLDNTDRPIEGVTMKIGTNLTTQSDGQGQFRLAGAPVGHIHLIADGSTANRPGAWPTLEFELTTVAGQNNDLGMPVYLLPLDLDNGVAVSESTGGTLTLPNYPGFALDIAPGSVTFPDGSRSGLISVTAVHADKVPMTPNFGQQPRFIITVQPANAIFDPPARITLPNTDGLAPGEITEMYSFDHDLGTFVAIGTGTVSEDGSVVVSDPGVGVRKAGWHCGGNPQNVAAGITSTVSVDKAELNLCVGEEATVTATGGPTPAHSPTSFEWQSGRANVTPDTLSGKTSVAVIKSNTVGTYNVKVRYRCKSAQWSNFKEVEVNVMKVEMVSPTVDNKVKFDGSSSGKLEVTFEATATPDTADTRAYMAGRIRFEIDAIGSSSLAWDNPNGIGVYSGGKFKAKATFTGMPQKNSDFGDTEVRLRVNGCPSQDKNRNIKIFYTATASNHPGGGTDPNWFYYYKNQEGGSDYSYDGSLSTSESTPGSTNSIKIANNAYTGGSYIITSITGGKRRASGTSGTIKYWKYFSGVIPHERFHVSNGAGHGPTLDPDADDLVTTVETATVKSDPADKYSIDNGVFGRKVWDDECWAGGPIEKAGIDSADITVDWAAPGSQWP